MDQPQLPENYVSILQCVETFKLKHYTPEQIVDQIFSTQKTQPMPKDQFLINFKSVFDRNVTPDYTEYIDGGAERVFFVCAQDAKEITVDQLGNGICAFTSRKETHATVKDMFYYLNYTYKAMIQEEDIQEFLKEVTSAAVSKVTSLLPEFKKSLMKDKGNTDMSYWTLYVWRSHPVVKGLTEIYREIHNIQSPSGSKLKESGYRLSSPSNALHKSGYIQAQDFRISAFNGTSVSITPSPRNFSSDQIASTLGSTLGANIQVERGANKLTTSHTFFGHEQAAK